MNFSVIGLGSFGMKRAKSIQDSNNAKLINVYDINPEKAQNASMLLGVPSVAYEDILKDHSIDIVCICAPNKFHQNIIVDVINNNKNVFCEKPLARNLKEAQYIYNKTIASDKIIQVGSNHRFFESVKKAKKLVDEGAVGEVLSFNGRIGHDGERLKNSWFWDKDISGGGTLLDNGCHLLDLARYFIGDFTSGKGLVSNSYWKNISVEDTAGGIFTTEEGKMATIFCSWRLRAGYFFFEINGSDGYINVDGRFDTHGGDKIYWCSKNKKDFFTIDYSELKPDSYKQEIEKFVFNLKNNNQCRPSVKDALEVMKMIDLIYN
jgi:predicted dehydrogenase